MEQYIDYLYIIPAALIAIMCHELTHGLFSYMQGDPTPKEQGRLSLNPAKHLDLFGTLCLIFLGFSCTRWSSCKLCNSIFIRFNFNTNRILCSLL